MLTPNRPSRVNLFAFLTLMALLFIANFAMVGPYLIAVLMGAILAVLFRRSFNWLNSKKIPRPISAGTITVLVGLLVVIPVTVFSLLVINQAIEVAQRLLADPHWSFTDLANKITNWNFVSSAVGDASEIEKRLRDGVGQVAAAAPAVLFKFFGGLPDYVLQTFLGLISCYYFLIDGGSFIGWLRDKIPLDTEVRGAIFGAFRETAVSTIMATLSAAGMQTLIIVTGFTLLGVPAAFLAGGATFVLAWVPLVGSTPVWLSAAIYLFSQGLTLKAGLMIGVGMLTGVSDNIVYPLVLKGRNEMHPLVSLVAIFGGIQFFGFLGVFIGPILTELLISLLRIWPLIGEKFGLLRPSAVVVTNSTPPMPSPTREDNHQRDSLIILPPGMTDVPT